MVCAAGQALPTAQPSAYYFYDGDRLTMELRPDPNGGFLVYRSYGWGAAGLEQIDYPNLYNPPHPFYTFDPQGHLVSRVLNGVAVDLACYDAFGQLVRDLDYAHPGLDWYHAGDPVGWGGQWGAYTVADGWGASINGTWKQQGALILLTHRYYNPDTGRFLTRDPIGYNGGVNIYAYTRNNPIMGRDPLGLDDDDDEFHDSETYIYGRAFGPLARKGKKALNEVSKLNPINNIGTVISGTDATGAKVSKSERAWAVLNTVPWGKLLHKAAEVLPLGGLAAGMVGHLVGDSGKALALGRTEGGAWTRVIQYLIRTRGPRGFFTIGAGMQEIERGMQAAGSIHFDLEGVNAAFLAQRFNGSSRFTAQEWEYLVRHSELWERTHLYNVPADLTMPSGLRARITSYSLPRR